MPVKSMSVDFTNLARALWPEIALQNNQQEIICRLMMDGKITCTCKREGFYNLADGLEPSGMSPDIEA
jgi:hypothetical protein